MAQLIALFQKWLAADAAGPTSSGASCVSADSDIDLNAVESLLATLHLDLPPGSPAPPAPGGDLAHVAPPSVPAPPLVPGGLPSAGEGVQAGVRRRALFSKLTQAMMRLGVCYRCGKVGAARRTCSPLPACGVCSKGDAIVEKAILYI